MPVPFTPLPLMMGFAPVLYMSMTMGLAALPEPFGLSEPVQLPPALNRMLSPGANVVALTLVSVCHGVDVLVPLLESIPPAEST